jgi:hyperosmotically inducible protein
VNQVLFSALAIALALTAVQAQQPQDDSAIQASVQKALDTPYCKNVHASVKNGVVTLTGYVDLYLTRIFAEQQAAKVWRGGLHDEIQVTGPNLPDRQLKANLEDAIRHRNNNGGAEASRYISIHVKNGAVTLSGHASEPTLSAVSMVVAKMPGVKDLILNVLVYPKGLHGEALEWPSAAPSIGVSGP